MKRVVKIEREGNLYRCYRRDKRGWFKSGWGWSLEQLTQHWAGLGYQVRLT